MNKINFGKLRSHASIHMYITSETAPVMSDSDETGIGISLFDNSNLSLSSAKVPKRKHEDDSTSDVQQEKKRKRSRKPKDVNDEALDAVLGVNHAIGRMDSRLMADHIAQRTRRFGSELSTVEIEDSYIPGQCRQASYI